jgi:hypothetical protein
VIDDDIATDRLPFQGKNRNCFKLQLKVLPNSIGKTRAGPAEIENETFLKCPQSTFLLLILTAMGAAQLIHLKG